MAWAFDVVGAFGDNLDRVPSATSSEAWVCVGLEPGARRERAV